jgi:hypothetical protein
VREMASEEVRGPGHKGLPVGHDERTGLYPLGSGESKEDNHREVLR